MFDEITKVVCHLACCENNLKLLTDRFHCKLKYIVIGMKSGVIYPVEAGGGCLNYKEKKNEKL
jgi:hypothetical protein